MPEGMSEWMSSQVEVIMAWKDTVEDNSRITFNEKRLMII